MTADLMDAPARPDETSHASDRRSGDLAGGAIWTVLKIVVLLWCAFNVVLLLWVAMNSFRGGSRIFSRPLELPTSLSFLNYVSAWTDSSLGQGS